METIEATATEVRPSAADRANQAVARREERSRELAHSPAPASESAAMLQMIERIIRDPSIDIERVRAVIGMKKEIDMEAAKRLFDAAMSETQSEIRVVGVDKDNSQTHSKYASYAALDRAVRPIYTKHGFSLVFDTAASPLEAHIRMLCDVAHDGGYTRQFHVDMPADGKGAKGGDVMTKTHATGSALTYGQRYLLKMIFNIAVGDATDDDGNAAGAASSKSLSPEQVEAVKLEIVRTDSNIPIFFQFVSSHLKRDISKIEDIPASAFQDVMDTLAKKANRDKK